MKNFLDSLYSDVGNKIKTIVKWSFLVMAILTTIAAIVMLIGGVVYLLDGYTEGLIMILGAPFAWVIALFMFWFSSLPLFCVGEITDRIVKIDRKTSGDNVEPESKPVEIPQSIKNFSAKTKTNIQTNKVLPLIKKILCIIFAVLIIITGFDGFSSSYSYSNIALEVIRTIQSVLLLAGGGALLILSLKNKNGTGLVIVSGIYLAITIFEVAYGAIYETLKGYYSSSLISQYDIMCVVAAILLIVTAVFATKEKINYIIVGILAVITLILSLRYSGFGALPLVYLIALLFPNNINKKAAPVVEPVANENVTPNE